LATSILWGLAKASGRPLPTIIDTPLGRLDSSHRRHLLERYFPVASHQVILLSTDKEIDETSLKHLQPFVGREYQLMFNESSRSTEIIKGYFWNHETAA
jgi:DNA sulfur modification protein DndD